MKLIRSLVLTVLALFAGLAVFAQTQLARQWRSSAIPNISGTIASAATHTLTSSNATFALVPGGGVGLLVQYTGTTGTTGDVTCAFGVSMDGSTVTTANYFTIVGAANGTNWVRYYTNVPASFIGNARYLAVRSIANASGGDIANLSITAITPDYPKN